MKIALLTGGKDPHYARGLARELALRGVHVALVGSPEEMVAPGEAGPGRIDLHGFVGPHDPDAGLLAKMGRVASDDARVAGFAARTDARLFHILWFRRLPPVERTLLLAYLRRLGKKLVFTAHNVDDRARDGRPGGFAERVSIRFLYQTVFVHTSRMKHELVQAFGVPEQRVTVVPLGLNDVIPVSSATRRAVREQLSFGPDDRILLFFGNIAPYKGVEDLIRALAILAREDDRLTLVIAGRVKNRSCEAYWRSVEALIAKLGVEGRVRTEICYLPDAEVGLFFRAADASMLPYRRVYQSGVLGLSYAQGLPVIAADVGSWEKTSWRTRRGSSIGPVTWQTSPGGSARTSPANSTGISRSGARRSATSGPSGSRGRPMRIGHMRCTSPCYAADRAACEALR
jgi:D-inositol-3-phosphate glycosyltransferase